MYQGKANTVGRMRYRITIQSSTVSSGMSAIESWSNRYTGLPADYEYARGGMQGRGRQIEEGVDAIFTIRNRSGIVTTDRVVFDSQNYGIVFVRPVAGRERYIELHCKLVT